MCSGYSVVSNKGPAKDLGQKLPVDKRAGLANMRWW